MIDTTKLLQILSINRLTKSNAPSDVVDRVLTALRYSPEEKQQALEALRSQGWNISGSVQVAPQPASVPSFGQISSVAPAQQAVQPIAAQPIAQPITQPAYQPVSQPMAQAAPSAAPQPIITMPIVDMPVYHKKHWLAYIVLIVVLFVAGGGGVFAYYTFINPSLSPTDIFKKALLATSNIRSFSFNATSTGLIDSKISDAIPGSLKYTVSAGGAIDFHSLDTLSLKLNLSTNVDAKDATTTAATSLGINVVYLQKNIYLNLDNLDVSYNSSDPKAAGSEAFVEMVKGFASSTKNKWIQFDASQSLSTTTEKQYLLTDADIAMIQDYIAGMSYVTAISRVDDETVNNVLSYHLQMSIQPDQKLSDLAKKITLEKGTVAPKDMTEFNKQFDAASAKAMSQKVDLDMWIGKEDFLIYKTMTAPVVITDAQSGFKSTTRQEAVFSNYNQPTSIVAPQGAIPFQELIQGLFSATMNATVPTTTPVKAKTPVKKVK